MIFAVGSSSITVKDIASLKSNLQVSKNLIEWQHAPEPITLTTTTYNNESEEATIYGTSKAESVTNSGASSYINLGGGADKLTNTADEVTIIGGAGKDIITSGGKSISINGGADADKISLESNAEDATIAGGTGNDTIYTNGNGNLIQYATGDGNDVIVGFTTNDTLQLTSGNYSFTFTDGKNGILKIGDDLVTLGGAGASIVKVAVGGSIKKINFANAIPVGVSLSSAGTSMTVSKDFTGNVIDLTKWAGTENVKNVNASALSKGVSIIGNSIDNSIVGGKGNDTIYSGIGDNVLTGGNGKDVFVYSQDDDIIKDYTAGKDTIVLAEDVKISSQYAKEESWIIKTNKGALMINDSNGKNLTIFDSEGNKVSSNSEISKLIEDDNFVNDTAQIDSITEITDTNYSVGKITDTANVGNFTNDTLSAVYAYSNTK